MTASRPPASRACGFTLIEVCITVAIIALAAGMVVPSLNNWTRAELRQAANRMAATVRGAYDDAALQGQIFRLTLTPGKAEILVESTDTAIAFDNTGAAVEAAQAQGPTSGDPLAAFDLNAGEATPAPPAGPLGPLGGLAALNGLAEKVSQGTFAKVRTVILPGTVRLMDLWTDGMQGAEATAPSYLHFFPNGYTQDAIIHLTDGERRIFSLRVAPLSGRCRIEPGYLEVPR